jgi:hypothetical protein
MIHQLNHSYATKSAAILRAVEFYREWIEGRLGVPLSDAVVRQTEYGFHNVAIRRLIGYVDPYASVPTFRSRLAEYIESAEIPASVVPIIQTTKQRVESQSGAALASFSEELSAFENGVE